jgi:MFS family permease
LVGVVLSSLLDAHALQSYGWRIAFLLGAIILPIGFVIRRSLPETLHAEEPALPATPGDQLPWRAIVLGFFMLGGATIGFYVLAYLTTFSSQVLHMKTNVAFAATVVFGLSNIIFSALAGALSDRFGRWPVMVIPRALFALAVWPAFALLVARRDALTLLSMAFILGALGQMGVTGFVALSEALPKRTRCAALATTYALAITIFGGTTQLAVTWLIHVTGSPMAPAYYLLAGAIMSLVAMALMDETAPAVLRRRALQPA